MSLLFIITCRGTAATLLLVKLDGDNAVYTGLQGKGLQMTYWLHGKKGFDKPLPAFDKYVCMFDD